MSTTTPNRPVPRFSSGDLVWTPADSQGIVSTFRWLDGAYVYGIKVGAMAYAWAESELRPSTKAFRRLRDRGLVEAQAGAVAS